MLTELLLPSVPLENWWDSSIRFCLPSPHTPKGLADSQSTALPRAPEPRTGDNSKCSHDHLAVSIWRQNWFNALGKVEDEIIVVCLPSLPLAQLDASP